LYETRQKLVDSEISISNAIVTILPQLRGRLSDEALQWFASELQGYPNALQFYQSNEHTLPNYRVVRGTLKLVEHGGIIAPVTHPFASRNQYFLGAPIAWLEDFAGLPGKLTLVELPDLTSFLGVGRGNVGCEFTKDQLTRILAIVKGRVIGVMDKVLSKQQPGSALH